MVSSKTPQKRNVNTPKKLVLNSLGNMNNILTLLSI